MSYKIRELLKQNSVCADNFKKYHINDHIIMTNTTLFNQDISVIDRPECDTLLKGQLVLYTRLVCKAQCVNNCIEICIHLPSTISSQGDDGWEV